MFYILIFGFIALLIFLIYGSENSKRTMKNSPIMIMDLWIFLCSSISFLYISQLCC